MTGRLVVLASGNGSNLQAVLDGLPGAVVAVLSDRPEARALERAVAAQVPAVALPPAPGQARRDYDAVLADAVAAHDPDWVVLAGWMRLLSTAFLDRFPGRVVNLHPALPGTYPGVRAIERAFADSRGPDGPGRTGVMVHLVPDEGVDDGPVLAVAEVPIHPDDTLDDLAARVHAVEHRLLVSTLHDLIQGARR